MGRNTTEAEVVVTLNGQTARNELEKLEKELKFYRDAAEEAYKQGKKALGKEMAKEAERLEKEVKVAKKEMKDFTDVVKHLNSKTIKEMEQAAKQLEKQLKNLTRDSEEFEKKSWQYKQITERIKAMKDAYKQTSSASRQWLKSLSDVSGGLLIMGKGIKTAIALAGRFMDAYKVISNFEQANANLASILGATSDQMEVLEKAAIQLGSSTRYSASQVTGLQTELAKLGFTVKEITDMSPAVLNFAGSVGTDLASAAALAGVALRSFNLGSEQTEDALGTMAVACNKSALSFEYLQNSFSTIAPVAKTYGLSLKDTIALLGTLANAGFDASSAATATRNILLNLSDTNGKLAKALGGSVHSFEDIMGAMKKLRDQGVDLNTTLELTDKRSVAAFNTFLDGAESAITLRGELENVNGELQKMAEQRAATVEGAIDGMKSAWEGLVLSFRKSTGPIASVVNLLTKAIQKARTLVDPKGAYYQPVFDSAEEQFEQIMNWAAETGAKIEDVQSRLFDAAERMADKAKETAGGIWDDVAVSAIQNAYWDAADKAAKQAEEAEKKVLEVNAKYNAKQEAIYKERAQMLEKNSKAVGTKAWEDSEKRLEANRKEWDEALKDARRFKKEMDEIVSGDDSSTNNNTGGGGVDEKELKKQEAARKKAFADRKAQLEAFYNYETKMMKVKMLQGKMDEAEYNAAVKEKKGKLYADLLALAEKYKQDDSSILASQLDDQIKDLEDAAKKAAEAARKAAKEAEDAAKKEMEEWEKKMKELEELEKKAQDVRDSLRPKERINREYENELQNLEDLHTAKLISEQDYLDAVDKLHKDHNKALLDEDLANMQEYVEKADAVIEFAGNFVTQLKEFETQKMEAEYQAQLTAAGDNAEKREAIESEYEQKKLDLQKKYADVEMGINIAKAIGAGALAVMQAWAAAGGQPILFAIYAALIAATTAVEIATMVKQRNAIKNASVSGSSTPSIKTGQRTMTGYAEGGYTEGHATLTTVGEKGVEYVIPNWMVRKNPVMVANLERYRKAGSHGKSGSVSRGFADGGFTTPTDDVVTAPSNIAIEAAVYNGIRAALEGEWLRAYLVRKDLSELDAQDNRFKKQTAR